MMVELGLTPDLAQALGERARRAALAGDATFALPEAADAAEHLARSVPDAALREQAAGWISRGAAYHELVRLCAGALLAQEALVTAPASIYVPKAQDELEPALALWPHVLLFPTTRSLSMRDVVELRAFPIHPLGVRVGPCWADGRVCSPAEFFFHDLDHARFKVREDLLARSLEIPDAYRDGSTLDPTTWRHRVILPHAAGLMGSWCWTGAPVRHVWVRALLRRIESLADRALSTAAELMLFEVVHEKSFPLEPGVFAREVASDAHLTKLQRKCDTGFFGPATPTREVRDSLERARVWLRETA